jgi:hypothetical protein
MGGKEDLHCKLEKVWSTWTAGRPANLLGLHRLQASPSYSTDLPWHVYETVFENTPNPGWPAKEVGPTGPTLAWLVPGFVPHHLLLSYCLWLCLILDIMKICMDFGSYDAFSSSNVPEMVNQQNLWKSLVISTYLLYLEWNLGMFAVDMCILWPPTPPTLRVLLNPGQKKKN